MVQARGQPQPNFQQDVSSARLAVPEQSHLRELPPSSLREQWPARQLPEDGLSLFRSHPVSSSRQPPMRLPFSLQARQLAQREPLEPQLAQRKPLEPLELQASSGVLSRSSALATALPPLAQELVLPLREQPQGQGPPPEPQEQEQEQEQEREPPQQGQGPPPQAREQEQPQARELL